MFFQCLLHSVIDWDSVNLGSSFSRCYTRDDLRSVIKHEPRVENALGSCDALNNGFSSLTHKYTQGSSLVFGDFYSPFSRLFHAAQDWNAGLSENAPSLFLIRSYQPYNHWF